MDLDGTVRERPRRSPAAELVREIEGGDRAAEAALCERFSAGLLYLQRHLTRDPVVADDLLQETLLIALERIRRGAVKEPEKLQAFLRGIARRLALARFRGSARQRETRMESLPEMADPEPSPLSRAVRGEEARLALRLLGEMRSERDRQLLHRFCVLEEEKATVCEALNLTGQQFNVALFRARQRFRTLVRKAAKQAGEGLDSSLGRMS